MSGVMKKYVVQQLTANFRSAVELIKVPVPEPGPTDLLVKNRYVGINASDINLTAGRYNPGVQPPFDCGMEGLGTVVARGSRCQTDVRLGQAVGYINTGAFAEYTVIPEGAVMPLPSLNPEYVPMLVSGLTASISLDEVGEIKKGDKVLITAAAGGTGQFAVQWAKQAGCHVIGTCSTEAKAKYLTELGCDRVVVYSKEDLGEVLKREYKGGVNVVYETVGGDIFDTCVRGLAVKGRLVVIGAITGYQSESGIDGGKTSMLPMQMLVKSASVRGFLLFHYVKQYRDYFSRLVRLHSEGKMRCQVDNGTHAAAPFRGMESVADAVEYLYTRKSVGKIVVELPEGESKL